MAAGERRRLIVFGSVGGAVLVLAILAKFVLFSGGGGSNTAVTFPSPSLTVAASSTTVGSSRSTRTPSTFDVFATKNPFQPVIIVTPGSTPTGSTTPTTPTSGGTTGTTTGGSTGGSTTTTTVSSNQPSPGQSIALLDVFKEADGTPMAKVQVGSVVYTVGADQVFATSYRVVSLDAPCGQFLFGDAPFKLCEGEEVIK